MITEEQYNDLEKYLNKEMTSDENDTFEDELSKDKDLKDYLNVHQELPHFLQHLKKEKTFEEQLNAAKIDYLQSETSSSKKPIIFWMILGAILIITALIIWQFSSKATEEITPDLIFAEAFSETTKPTLDVQRNTQEDNINRVLYEEAFQYFENKNYSAAINTLDKINSDSKDYRLVLELKGYIKYIQGDYSNAINIFNTYLEQEDAEKDLVTWYQAFAYFKNNELTNAQKNLNIIISKNYPQAKKAKELLDVIKRLE